MTFVLFLPLHMYRHVVWSKHWQFQNGLPFDVRLLLEESTMLLHIVLLHPPLREILQLCLCCTRVRIF